MTVEEAIEEIERLYRANVEVRLGKTKATINQSIIFIQDGKSDLALELLIQCQKDLDSNLDP